VVVFDDVVKKVEIVEVVDVVEIVVVEGGFSDIAEVVDVLEVDGGSADEKDEGLDNESFPGVKTVEGVLIIHSLSLLLTMLGRDGERGRPLNSFGLNFVGEEFDNLVVVKKEAVAETVKFGCAVSDRIEGFDFFFLIFERNNLFGITLGSGSTCIERGPKPRTATVILS